MVQTTTVYTEGARGAEFLISVAAHDRSFDQVVVATDAAEYLSGTVMKTDGATEVRFDGTGTPSGILLLTTDAAASNKGGVLVSRDATYLRQALVWAAGVTEGQMTAAIAALQTAGLVARDSSDS